MNDKYLVVSISFEDTEEKDWANSEAFYKTLNSKSVPKNNIDDTFRRETSALVAYKKFSQFKNLFIITYEEEEVLTIEDTEIKVLPIWKWLLE